MFNDNEIELTSIEMNYLRISNTGESESSLNKKKVWLYTDLDNKSLDEGVEAYLETEGDDVDVDRLCAFITVRGLFIGKPCICLTKEYGDKLINQKNNGTI